MPISPQNPFIDTIVTVFNPVGGTPTGSKAYAPSPVRGRLIEAGFLPASLVASAMTLAVAIDNHPTSNTSNFTNQITSTLGTFSSAIIFEGNTMSVIPATNVFVNQGDAIQWTTSGGNTSAIGTTLYAIIRRG